MTRTGKFPLSLHNSQFASLPGDSYLHPWNVVHQHACNECEFGPAGNCKRLTSDDLSCTGHRFRFALVQSLGCLGRGSQFRTVGKTVGTSRKAGCSCSRFYYKKSLAVGDQSRACFVTKKKLLKKQPAMMPQDPHTAHSPTALVHATELHYFLSSCWYNLVLACFGSATTVGMAVYMPRLAANCLI